MDTWCRFLAYMSPVLCWLVCLHLSLPRTLLSCPSPSSLSLFLNYEHLSNAWRPQLSSGPIVRVLHSSIVEVTGSVPRSLQSAPTDGAVGNRDEVTCQCQSQE